VPGRRIDVRGRDACGGDQVAVAERRVDVEAHARPPRADRLDDGPNARCPIDLRFDVIGPVRRDRVGFYDETAGAGRTRTANTTTARVHARKMADPVNAIAIACASS